MIRRGLLISALVGAYVAGCDEAPPPPSAAAPARAAGPAATAAPTDGGIGAPQYVYTYNPVGKRDPFRASEEQISLKFAGGEGPSVCNEPLCQHDLDQLVLVAVVSGDANPMGMIEDPSKTGHIVRRNSKVGKQGGKVTAILRDCVVVTEYFRTPDGKVNPNRVNLCVKKDSAAHTVIDLLQNKAIE